MSEAASQNALVPQLVMVHKVLRWVENGTVIEEHAEDTNDDDAVEIIFDVWVRAGEFGEQPEEIEKFGGQFKTLEFAMFYAASLATALDIEVEQY